MQGMDDVVTVVDGPSTQDPMREEKPQKKHRGFAAMDPERQREIASLGGKAAHAKGTAHKWNEATARAAGKKGGKAAQQAKRAFFNRG